MLPVPDNLSPLQRFDEANWVDENDCLDDLA